MKHIPVSSSQIASVAHDPDNSLLQIKFNSGSTYQYSGVPASLYEEMLKAPSIGTFFGKQIKARADLYPYTKVQDSVD